VKCDICRDTKSITLPVHRDLTIEDMVGDYAIPVKAGEMTRSFPCPNCAKLVPFERVRAMRAMTKIDFETFGKLQNPTERGLAQQFGAYLHKEGLLRFDNDSLTTKEDRVTVRAMLNIVLPENAEGVEALVAEVEQPPIPGRILREMRQRASRGEVVSGYNPETTTRYDPEVLLGRPTTWKPRAFIPEAELPAPKTKRETMKEAAAQRNGISNRFSGIDFDGDDLL
jgi:hypothetical protein